MSAYVVAVEGLDGLATLDDVPAAVLTAARRAVNATTDRARAEGARRIRDQINFPARYLSGASGKLAVTRYARTGDLTGVVRGRDRPTSLARFSRGGRAGQVGVDVEVKPGVARRLPRAFLFRLRSGSEGALGNLGLAVRTNGQAPRRAYKPMRVDENLWLLYGPSVNQVFGGRGVAEQIGPGMADYLEREFTRLLALEID